MLLFDDLMVFVDGLLEKNSFGEDEFDGNWFEGQNMDQNPVDKILCGRAAGLGHGDQLSEKSFSLAQFCRN